MKLPGKVTALASVLTIAYSTAVVDMSSAIVACDIDAARDAWSRLTGDVNPKAVALATKALDEGDWNVLNSLLP